MFLITHPMLKLNICNQVTKDILKKTNLLHIEFISGLFKNKLP